MRTPLHLDRPLPGSLDEALACIRGEEVRRARLFARRQTVLLRQHLREFLGADHVHCEDPETFFYYDFGQVSRIGFFRAESLFEDECILQGHVGLGHCEDLPGLRRRLAALNESAPIGRIEWRSGTLEHRYEQVVVRDLTEREVTSLVVGLVAVPSSAIEVLQGECGMEEPAAFTRLARKCVWGRPESFDPADPEPDVETPGADEGDAPLPLVPMVESTGAHCRDALVERFVGPALDHLAARVGGGLDLASSDDTPGFSWEQGGVGYRLSVLMPAGQPWEGLEHVCVRVRALLGRVPARYEAARGWVRERLEDNGVTLVDEPLDIPRQLLTLQATSMLRPGDVAGLGVCLDDLRGEAESILGLIGVYHELVSAPEARQMLEGAWHGYCEVREEFWREWSEPGPVARELLREGAPADLDRGIRLAWVAEDWRALLGLVARKRREVPPCERWDREEGLNHARVRACYRLGRWRAGLRLLSPFLAPGVEPETRERILNAMAAGYLGLGLWEEMFDVLRGVSGRRVPRVHYHRGLALLGLGRPSEARREYDEYVEAMGPDPYAQLEYQKPRARAAPLGGGKS